MTSLSIRQRLLLLTLLPSTLIAIVLVAYFTYSAISSLEKELHAKGVATVRYLAPVSEYGIIAGQQESLHGLVQAAIQEPGAKSAVVVNSKGKTMAVSGRVSLPAELLRDLPREPQIIADNSHWVAFGAPVWRSLDDSDPLFEADGLQDTPSREIIGSVFVEFDKTELGAQQTRLFQRGLVIVLAGLLVLAGLAISIADRLAQPLVQLANAVRSMSSGNFAARVAAQSPGEIGILENGFNEMAQHIEESHHSLQARIEEATVQLAYQARHDALTGLVNRREFEHRLEKSLLGIQAGGDESSVLFIDLDRFKHVNDTCGYLAGDELLRQVAQLLLGRLREEDLLGRLGGDEFSILLNNCGKSQARQIAEDICALVSAYRFIWQEKVFAIGASIGVTTINRKVRTIAEVISVADSACHQAKNAGRNRICEQEIVATPERRQEGSHWASRIASALAEDRLLVEAMPMRSLNSGAASMHYVELTVRLNESGQPPVELPALLDAAERYDLAESIDQRMIDVAIDARARAIAQERGLYCLVPLSRSSLSNRATIDYISRQLAARGINGKGLCFLFSEDSLTHSTSQTMEFAREMHKLGCEVGLDEFGGGLASFSHLRSIEPDFIKLSRNLTRDLQKSRTATALLRAIREITSDQDIYSIADGIDDAELLEQVKLLGIDYATGKIIAPREPFEVWLEGAVMR